LKLQDQSNRDEEERKKDMQESTSINNQTENLKHSIPSPHTIQLYHVPPDRKAGLSVAHIESFLLIFAGAFFIYDRFVFWKFSDDTKVQIECKYKSHQNLKNE
jgi:hypothetical protein